MSKWVNGWMDAWVDDWVPGWGCVSTCMAEWGVREDGEVEQWYRSRNWERNAWKDNERKIVKENNAGKKSVKREN